MPIVALIAAAAGLVWGAIYARRGSLILGSAALLVVAYVLGHPFWHVKVGPLPVTLDRVLLVGLLSAFVAQWRWGRLDKKRLSGSDWLLFGLLVLLTASALVSGSPESLGTNQAPPLWRLVMSFLVPGALYWIARQAPLSRREWTSFLCILALLGGYLGITAVAEITKQWSFVFPRYISDPTLGIHFGRARGPDLNSASLGVYLTVALWSAWIVRKQVGRAWQLLLLGLVPLTVAGVFFTYTRSTWIGLVASGLAVGFFELPRRWRIPAFASAAVLGAVVAMVGASDVVDLQREGTAEESRHSVDQRKSFAYVSWQMFQDHPILGVGFGRFYDQKLPYLSDRSQEFELESLRPLHHHNTLLSVLTETGMVGLGLFVALLAAWTRSAWSLARDANVPAWIRGQGVLMLAVLGCYLSSAVFHDLTLMPSQEWLLFVFAGLTMNLRLSTATHLPTDGSEARVDERPTHEKSEAAAYQVSV